MSSGTRRRGREVALQVLYQLDVQEALSVEQGLAAFFGHLNWQEDDVRPGFSSDEKMFIEQLVRGVRQNLGSIDESITRASRNWRLDRMARVDRNLLRLAVFELRHSGDVPGKVALNEAIEIAKRFGTAESPAFVNGILDRCLEETGETKGGRPPVSVSTPTRREPRE
jgi:N utilization substance protein B